MFLMRLEVMDEGDQLFNALMLLVGQTVKASSLYKVLQLLQH